MPPWDGSFEHQNKLEHQTNSLNWRIWKYSVLCPNAALLFQKPHWLVFLRRGPLYFSSYLPTLIFFGGCNMSLFALSSALQTQGQKPLIIFTQGCAADKLFPISFIKTKWLCATESPMLPSASIKIFNKVSTSVRCHIPKKGSCCRPP